MERIIKQRTWPKGPEASLALFKMFGHGLISNTGEAETLPQDLGPHTDPLEPETIVVDKLSASTAQANVIAAQLANEEGKVKSTTLLPFRKSNTPLRRRCRLF